MGAQEKSLNIPDLTQTLDTLKRDIFYSLNCIKIGEIESFDLTKKTAKVKIQGKRILVDGTILSYPALVDCPVVTIQGDGNGGLAMPITAGDQCVLLFADRNIDAWFSNGSAQEPNDARAHDYSDAIALVGINSLVSSLPAAVAGKIKLFYGPTYITIEKATGLITLGNASTTLVTLLDSFIDLLKTLQVQDPISGPTPLTVASIAALETFKSMFASLLG